MNKISFEFQTQILTVVLEAGWKEYEDKDTEQNSLLTFIKENTGVGALQISLATSKTDQAFNITKTLEQNGQQHITKIDKYNINDFTVYEYEDYRDERYIKYFNLVKPYIMILATYNCESRLKNEMEINETRKIVRSIVVINK
jgi:hypothetical protein